MTSIEGQWQSRAVLFGYNKLACSQGPRMLVYSIHDLELTLLATYLFSEPVRDLDFHPLGITAHVLTLKTESIMLLTDDGL